MTENTLICGLQSPLVNLRIKFLFNDLSVEINLVARQFIVSLIIKYGKHPVYLDGSKRYPEACNIRTMKHYLHSPYEKLLINNRKSKFLVKIQGQE